MNPTTTIVLATHNQGKVREFTALLRPFGLEVLGMDSFPHVPEVDETGTTFEENALLKATEVSRATGLVALADDSGLEVEYLNNEPGVYSARYSATPGHKATDAGNVQLVLQKLAGVPAQQRGGRFQCCMAAATPQGATMVARGTWAGRLGEAPVGENGFGYDPIFIDLESGKTAAELSREAKNAISHRARAVQKLLELWPAFWHSWLATQSRG